MTLRVLISGGSVSAYTLAWWLDRSDKDVQITIVERAPGFREGGQNIDVRGAARRVLQRMDVERTVKESNTGERGMNFVDDRGRSVALFSVEEFGSEGMTAELEILRGDLSRVLRDAIGSDNDKAGKIDHIYDDYIVDVVNNADNVGITFKSGKQTTYDILVVAEGVGSSTRDLVFKGENKPRYMDMTSSFFTIPKGGSDDEFAKWYTAPGGLSMLVRPDNYGTTRVCLNAQGAYRDVHKGTVEEQKAFFIQRFQHAQWETARILQGCRDTKDMYTDTLRQVKMARWHRNRVVLTGDAAWCPTPLGGIGASLAIVGAYILAGELLDCQDGDYDGAFSRYDKAMRPFAEKGQAVPKIIPRLLHPRSRWGVAVVHFVLRILASRPARFIFNAFSPKSEAVDIPKYRAFSHVSDP
jgi:2-polyprenyl-6-methoxyphenol hydroxylase-like FAD-dependent oxidoreductase